jgi:ATP-dependent exoDNAse (exonuclease V) beta subunit
MSRLIRAFREESLNGNSPPLVWLLKQRAKAGSVDRWDEDCGEDVNLSDEGVDAVRAMTIHKAKGLESPVVIIYSWIALLEESLRSANGLRGQRKLELTTADGSRLRAVSFQWGPLRIVTDNFLEAARLDSLYSSEEAIRLAYVAVTRASDQLFLLHTPSRMIDTEFIQGIRNESPPIQFSEWTPGESTRIQRPTAPITLNMTSYDEYWNRRRDSSEVAQPLLRHPTDLDFHPPTGLRQGRSTGSSVAAGRLVHAYLERKLTGHFDKSLFEELGRQLDPEETDVSAILQAERILEDLFSGRTLDPSGLPLSERLEQCRILGQELPVFLTIGGQPWHGVIDLIIEEEDSLSAIDFKTGPLTDPLPETYLQQERVYGEAVRRLCPDRETHFEFWWLGTGEH